MLPPSISAADPLASGPGAPSSFAEPAPAGTVIRPEPGLARGRWEAPPWTFYAVAAAAVVLGVAWMVLAWRTRGSRARKEPR